ncbi:MAG TPA: hypothetical protein VD995_34175 [Azospirillum sp.]|nr:hypothetical protein [Azospirillum sp.]
MRVLAFVAALVVAAPALAQSVTVTVDSLLTRITALEEQMRELRARLDGSAAPGAAVGQPAPAGVQAGPVVMMHPPLDFLPHNIRPDQAPAVQEASWGGFIWSGGPVESLGGEKHGLRFSGVAAADFRGFLTISKPGTYQLSGAFAVRPRPGKGFKGRCLLAAWVERAHVGTVAVSVEHLTFGNIPAHNGKGFAVLPVTFPQPGLYDVRLVLGCPPAVQQLESLTVEPLIQAPGELNARPITPAEWVHKPTG